MVITDHQGMRGLKDTLCLGDWQVQLPEGGQLLWGLCGALGGRKAELFCFWGLVLSLAHLHPHRVAGQMSSSRGP